jgi:hypothetical protein
MDNVSPYLNCSKFEALGVRQFKKIFKFLHLILRRWLADHNAGWVAATAPTINCHSERSEESRNPFNQGALLKVGMSTTS